MGRMLLRRHLLLLIRDLVVLVTLLVLRSLDLVRSLRRLITSKLVALFLRKWRQLGFRLSLLLRLVRSCVLALLGLHLLRNLSRSLGLRLTKRKLLIQRLVGGGLLAIRGLNGDWGGQLHLVWLKRVRRETTIGRHCLLDIILVNPLFWNCISVKLFLSLLVKFRNSLLFFVNMIVGDWLFVGSKLDRMQLLFGWVLAEVLVKVDEVVGLRDFLVFNGGKLGHLDGFEGRNVEVVTVQIFHLALQLGQPFVDFVQGFFHLVSEIRLGRHNELI